MAIDVDMALGHRWDTTRFAWTDREVMLYHLGLGAARDPLDRAELSYAYEADLKVLPTFSVLAPDLGSLSDVPGMDVDDTLVLHGEQEIVVHAPLATSGALTVTAGISEIWDKHTAALVVMEAELADEAGTPLATHRISAFCRGAGGFGGQSGPASTVPLPEGDPDHVWERTTREDQALLYRLSGDRNPIHADPDLARSVGFDRPILHGLCTYGIVCKAVVDELLSGDVTAVAGYRARFAGVVIPGETLRIAAWDHPDGTLLQVDVVERGTPALTAGLLTTRG